MATTSKEVLSFIIRSCFHQIMRMSPSLLHHLDSHHRTRNPFLLPSRIHQREMGLLSQSLQISQVTDSETYDRCFGCILSRFSVTIAFVPG